MTATADTHERRMPGNVRLFTGFLAGPLAWIAQLQVVYALASAVCHDQASRTALHAVSAAALAIAACGGLLSLVNWLAVRKLPPSELQKHPARHINFVGIQGMLTCSLFVLMIAAQWIAVALLRPCPHYE